MQLDIEQLEELKKQYIIALNKLEGPLPVSAGTSKYVLEDFIACIKESI